MYPSVFEFGVAKINQQANFYAGGFQVINYLSFVFRG